MSSKFLFSLITVFAFLVTSIEAIEGYQACLPEKSYYLFIKERCVQEGHCCSNNLECASACCDRHLGVCLPDSKTDHFLENFPYSTACMKLPMLAYMELEKIIEARKYCKVVEEDKRVRRLISILAPILSYIVSQAIGQAIGLSCIYCKLKKRNKKQDAEVLDNEEKMNKLIFDLQNKKDEEDPNRKEAIDTLAVIQKLKNEGPLS
jgi:hypothetical protein